MSKGNTLFASPLGGTGLSILRTRFTAFLGCRLALALAGKKEVWGSAGVLEITIIPIDFRMIVGYDGVAPSRAITE